MANLYSLAGQGNTSGAGAIAGGIGSGISGLSLPATLMGGPIAGAAVGAVGGLTSLLGGLFGANEQEAAGKRMYKSAAGDYQSAVSANPMKYSTQGISNTYNSARGDLAKSNASSNNALMDRYSSLQRKQMRNKISSGLTSGEAQASAIQNNVAFQNQANQMFQQQGQQMSNLDLREGQAKFNAIDTIDARKRQLAQKTLAGAGISNSTALQGLTGKLAGY